MSTQTTISRKKNILHTKGLKARVHIGTRYVTVNVSIPISKLVRALAKRRYVKPI